MKTVLCYGDSLSWGYNPVDATRYPPEHRWPRVMERAFGEGVQVIEENLNGRTVASDSPFLPFRNGRAMLGPVLETHAPLDLVIVMLGGNDCAPMLGLTAKTIAAGCAMIIWDTQKSQAGPNAGAPDILLVAPPLLGEPTDFMELFFERDEEISRALPGLYRMVAERWQSHFFDASTVVSASAVDGVHLDPEAQITLGTAIAEAVRKILAYDRRL